MKITNEDLLRLAALCSWELKPGGYVVKILHVEDNPSREYLKIYYDIAEGEHKGCYSPLNIKLSEGFFCVSYKIKAMMYFSRFISAVEESNPGYHFVSANISELVGKLLGIVLREEEYVNYRNIVVKRLNAGMYTSIDNIRKDIYPSLGPKRLNQNNYRVKEENR